MKPIYTVLLIGLLTGCGKKEASKPQAEAKVSSTQDAKKGKPKTPSKPNPTKPAPKSETTQQVSKPKTNPWDTPLGLALFMADNTREPMKISILVAQAQVKAGDKEQALATLKQATAEVQKLPEKERHPMMLTLIAKAQVDAGNKEQALATLKLAIVDPRSKPHGQFAIIEVLAYAGDKEQALAVFEQLAASAPKTGPGKEMVLAGKASILAQVGEIKKAVEAVQTIEDPSAKAILLTEIAKAQAKEGDKPKASATFRQAKETLAKIKEKFSAQKTDYLEVIAEAQIKAGLLELALATCKQYKAAILKIEGRENLKLHSLVHIAMIQVEAGDTAQALVTLKQAEEFVQYEEADGLARDYSLDRLAIGLALAGKPKQALETAQKIGKTSEKADVLMDIDGILGAAGNQEQGLPPLKQGLQMALKEIQKLEDARRKEYALISIMTKLAMEPITPKMIDGAAHWGDPIRPDQPMKKAFTAEEKELAKQFVEAIQPK